MFMDFGIMSVLLVFAHVLRSRVKLLQDIFLPTPIIAGMLGLFAGEQFLDVLPFSKSESGASNIVEYPFYLVVLLFATLFLGARKKSPSIKTVVRNVGDTFFYNLASEIGMFGFALLFGLLVLGPLFPALHSGFSLLLPAGFVGGHGTANVVGTVLEAGSEGLQDAMTIGYTFATVGLLAGILGGMLLINIATRCRWTRMVRSAHGLPESVRKGFLAKEEQRSMGQETVSPIAVDPLTWHIALVLVAFAAAFFVRDGIKAVIPGDYSIPLFALSMLAGACLQKALDTAGLGQYVDRRVMDRIGSSVSDYLIAFGVASIKITVVVKFAVPITILSVFGIVFAGALFWYIGRRIYHNFWFERSIFVYGWNTGVVAIGITLLRVVDPRLKTKTLEDFGLAYVFISVVEIIMLVTLPPLVAKGVILVPALVLIGGFFACILLSRKMAGWFRQPAHAFRRDEEDTIAESETSPS